MHKLILDNLFLINHSNMFRPLSRSHHQGVRNPWELQSHCIDLLQCCYVYVSASRYGSCGMLRRNHITTRTHIHTNILTDQYNGFVTLKDFELPADGFDWGAETCWSDWSVINQSRINLCILLVYFCLHWLRLFENRVLINLFGTKMLEGTREWEIAWWQVLMFGNFLTE